MLAACWPASLAQSVISRFSKRPFLTEVTRKTREDVWFTLWPPYTGTRVHIAAVELEAILTVSTLPDVFHCSTSRGVGGIMAQVIHSQ